MLRSYSLPRENKDAQAPWQLESLRPYRSRIEEQGLPEPLRLRLMRMPKDADVWLLTIQKGSPVLRELSAFVQNMTDGDAEARQFDHRLCWEPTLFIIIVDVARDGGDRSDLLQLFDHGPIANITGVENIIDAFKMSSDHGIESPVGIGNHSDPNGAPLVHGTTTVWDPIDACTCFQLKVNGSDDFFGNAASSAFNRSALAALIGCVESHSIRP